MFRRDPTPLHALNVKYLDATPLISQSRLRRSRRHRLSLTPEQIAQIKPLVEQTSSDIEAIREATTKQVADRIAETDSKIAPFLTPEQKAKLDQMGIEHREHMRRSPVFR